MVGGGRRAGGEGKGKMRPAGPLDEIYTGVNVMQTNIERFIYLHISYSRQAAYIRI